MLYVRSQEKINCRRKSNKGKREKRRRKREKNDQGLKEEKSFFGRKMSINN